MTRDAFGEVVEGEVVAREHLGQEDYLARVRREVFDGVEDRGEQSHVEPLHAPWFEERRGVEPRERLVGLGDRRAKLRQQLFAREPPALVELAVALAQVFAPARAADYPLPQVAFEVEEEVADAVRALARAPPDLLVGQSLKTAL